MPFAVNGTEATPAALEAAVAVAELLPNTPEDPLAGAVKVTLTPDTGLPPASFTVTPRGVAKAVASAALCGVAPAFAVIADAPAVFVSEKLIEERPVAAALTA